MAIASFVLGIISFVCCYFPLINLIFLFSALLSIVFGIAAIISNKKAVSAGQQNKNNSFPIIGIALSILSILIIFIINLAIFNIVKNNSFNHVGELVNKIEQYTDDLDFDINRGKIVIEPTNKEVDKTDEIKYETLNAVEGSSKIYSLGETFENSALAFSVIDLNTSYSVNNSSSVSTNKKVVQLTIKVQNLSDRKIEFNSSSIHVTDDDSVTCQRYYSNSNKDAEYLTDSLEPHSSKVITLKYTISKATEHITVKYDMYPISYDVVSFVLDNN